MSEDGPQGDVRTVEVLAQIVVKVLITGQEKCDTKAAHHGSGFLLSGLAAEIGVTGMLVLAAIGVEIPGPLLLWLHQRPHRHQAQLLKW